MNIEGWVAFLLVLFFIYPLVVLLHELGHAIAALALASGPVTIKMGDWRREHPLFVRRVGRLTLQWYRLPGWSGRCSADDIGDASVVGRIVFYLGGPLVSLLTAIAAYLVMFNLESGGFLWAVFQTIGNFALATLLLTIVPMRYPAWWGPYAGSRSDGANIMAQIRRMRQPAVSSENPS